MQRPFFGILSGGGLAMFYAVIELIPGIAEKAGIDGILISLPIDDCEFN